MAKGTRKGGGANKENNKTLTMNANNTDHSNTKAGSGASKNKSKDKQKIDLGETPANPVTVAQFEETNDPAAAAKKDHHKVQPTSTQIMLAQLIGGDPMDDLQKTKIKQVMDITGKPEDAVATALFDAGWDEVRAIDLLLEDGDHLTAWEETGKKNRKKQKQPTEDGKDENEDSEGFILDPRDKSGKRGPPRMRRGGSFQGGDRSFTRNNRTGDVSNGDGVGRDSGRGRGDQPPRRGGRGGGGTRGGDRSSYSGRGRRGGGGVGRDGVSTTGASSDGVGGFQGSIDTWNPSGSSGEASNGTAGSTSGKSGQRSRGGHHGNSKDAFDNAGNWGDDFPAADDWDNEEYTGSLADTKVFTASGQGGQGPQGKKGPQSSHSNNKQGQARPYPPQSQESPSNAVETVSGSVAASTGSVPPPSSAAVGAPTSTYSQPIDLSTLLHKPTTQSSIGTNSQQTLLQFSQQATDSLKAAVGIGQQPSSSAAASTKTGDQLYSSYASSAAGAGPNSNQTSYGQGNSAFTSIKSSQQSVPKQGAAAQNRSRMPPPSKIPNSAVEMPGDQLGRLDVQFGGLDLQFGGGGSSANSDSVNSFEFNGGPTSTSTAGNGSASATAEVDVANSKYLSGDKSKVAQPTTSSVDNYATKDKSGLSNAMNPSGKLGHNEGFADSRKAGSGPNTNSYSSRGQTMDKQGSETMNSYHGSSSQNYNNYGHAKSSYGQYGSTPNSYQSSYGSGGYGQNSYSTSTTTSSNYSKSYASDGKSGFQNDSNLSANPTAVLGLTTSTNVLSGKISATTASNKVNVPNLPPGVASMLPQHYMGLPAAFYGLQQPTPAMYSAYGNPGLEDIAALQRASGLHTLQAGYYDPNSQYAATSLPTAAAGNRGDGNATSMNLNSLGSTSTSSSSLSTAVTSNTNTVSVGASQQNNTGSTAAAGIGSGTDKSAFGNVTASDSTSSPIPSSSHQTMQNTATQQQPPLNFAATNAFAQHQQTALPPGYAYFYPNLQAYGGAGVYPATMAVPTAAGGTGTSQFQKSGYGTGYGTGGYESLGQQGSKDFGGYNSTSGKGSSSNTAAGGAGKGGHQYWGNNLTNSQLW